MNLSGLLDLLHHTGPYTALRETLAGGGHPGDLNLLRAARPFVLAALARDLKRPVLVVTARVDRAYNIAEQIPAWTPDVPVLRFAEPGPVFYERAPWGDRARLSRVQVLAHLTPPVGPEVEPLEGPFVVVASALALMAKTMPARQFRAGSRQLRAGQPAEPDKLVRAWLDLGYEPVSVVAGPGMFSRRGGILDVFPPAAEQPVRIEFWGDAIDSMRTFDPATQRSTGRVARLAISPAREALPRLAPPVAEKLRAWFAAQPDPAEDAASAQPDGLALAGGTAFPLLEYYLPYFYGQPGSLVEYLPGDALVVVEDWDELRDTLAGLEKQALGLRDGVALPPDYPLPYHTWDHLHDVLSARAPLHLAGGGEAAEIGAQFTPGARYGGQLRALMDHLVGLRLGSDRAVVVSRQAQRLAGLWGEYDAFRAPVTQVGAAPAPGDLAFVEGALAEGWRLRLPGSDLHLLTDAEIFGWRRPEPRRRPQKRAVAPEAYFADMAVGDFVVHIEYGIGRFGGMVRRVLDGTEREYLLVEYADSGAVYVPIHHADRLTRYVGVDERPPRLNRLGTADWDRAKQRTRRAVADIADDLLELYAVRAETAGYAFGEDTPWQHELEASFPYVETEDQLRALHAVKDDMESAKPMDRLICGDVGYGKTEVALRAAFKAVMDGKQVAMLVPTTVLAQQHYNTFLERLLSFPVNVEMLSRFRTPAEQAKIIAGLREGKIDIVIGTHRLLQSDVEFKDLGLLVIDEEQRFGVTHKEHFKQMRTEVDVLTLTATPIPRTLYMSLTGVRDISTIQTAPEDRLPVRTHVGTYDAKVVRQAILRELDRGGQVYYVHNRVQTIYGVADRLKALVPEATIEIGHGQMPENELSRVMRRFALGEFDVLVCTTIIESGLDIPNANTLVVDRSDWFGLAQLYQLRGRVGRGAHQAYAYFFHPRERRLTSDARARLQTIGEETQLGAGMNIAMRDLEIRGAGEVLGARQSGHIADVGFHLYTRMLAEAVDERKSAAEVRRAVTAPESETVIVDLPLPAFVPTDYVPETNLRLQLYRRLADMTGETAIDAMRAELTDRFGAPPPPVENLLYQLRVKVFARAARATKVSMEDERVAINLPYLAEVDRAALQTALGLGVRVTRTAVWLPEGLDQAAWQAMLLDVLKKLEASGERNPAAPTAPRT
ncbi:MAG: transcription-repair coupling factor [Anaerolineae bacterium]|nr:transcription-repair coupling factor [Anaerolineae bacterium]